jgi:hypothetical protein
MRYTNDIIHYGGEMSMFLCFLEYIYGICYFLLKKLPNDRTEGYLLFLKDKVFTDQIMFFTGIIAALGIVLSFLKIIFSKKRKSKILALILHCGYFYLYITYFLKMPVTTIFAFIGSLAGYITAIFK